MMLPDFLATFLKRLALLVAACVAGFHSFPVVFHVLISLDLVPQGDGAEGFGTHLIQRVIYVLCGCGLLGMLGLFIKERWGLVLLLSPFYAPSLYAIAYTLSQR